MNFAPSHWMALSQKESWKRFRPCLSKTDGALASKNHLYEKCTMSDIEKWLKISNSIDLIETMERFRLERIVFDVMTSLCYIHSDCRSRSCDTILTRHHCSFRRTWGDLARIDDSSKGYEPKANPSYCMIIAILVVDKDDPNIIP